MKEVAPKTTNESYSAEEYSTGGPNEELQGLIPTTLQSFDAGDQTQVGQAIARIASTILDYVDTGVVNAYLLALTNPFYDLGAYLDGFLLTFTPLNVNTGASTVNVNGLGVTPIVNVSGGALTGNEIQALATNYLKYDLANDEFVLLQVNAVDFALTAQLANNTDPTGASLIGIESQGVSTDLQTAANSWMLASGSVASNGNLNYGFNIASSSGTSGVYDITFTNALPNTQVIPTFTIDGASARIFAVTDVSTTGMSFRIIADDGALTNSAFWFKVEGTLF